MIAESAQIATDALQLVNVDYETLPVVVDCKEAMAAETVIHEQVGSNYTWQGEYEYGEVDKAFDEAKHVVKVVVISDTLVAQFPSYLPSWVVNCCGSDKYL